MKRLLLVSLWVALLACQRVSNDDTETALAEDRQEQREQAQAPYDQAVLNDPTEANRHFHRAAADFKAHRLTEAAAQIREGAGRWYEEVTVRNPAQKEKKEAVFTDLQQLAEQVEKGQVFTVAHLNEEFSQADLLGADLLLASSQEYLSAQDYEPAEARGRQGLLHLQQVIDRTGQTVDNETLHLRDDLRHLLDKIGQHQAVSVDTFSLKKDSLQVAVSTLTDRKDGLEDVDTTYEVR